MWKAMLVLFLTSNNQPSAMMVGTFPERFAVYSDCEKYITKVGADINTTVKEFTQYTEMGFEVKGHELTCVKDHEGELI